MSLGLVNSKDCRGVSFWERCDSCFNYNSKEKPDAELVCLENGNMREAQTVDNEIVFLMQGGFDLECDCYPGLSSIREGMALFLHKGCRLKAVAVNKTRALIVRFGYRAMLCANHSLEHLCEHIEGEADGICTLHINKPLEEYIKNFGRIISDGMCCSRFVEIKLQELFYIFHAFYPGRELAGFFRPILTTDMQFAGFILDNWRSMKSVEELMRLSGYSKKIFAGKFRRTFGDTASKWLNDKRGRAIYRELQLGTLPFSKLCDEYHFKTLQHFNYYCKKNFGLPPGQIRKNNGVQTCLKNMPLS